MMYKTYDFQLMRAVARGAENIFLDEGQDILNLLREQKKEYLYSGLDSIGTALRWLRQQIEMHLVDEANTQ